MGNEPYTQPSAYPMGFAPGQPIETTITRGPSSSVTKTTLTPEALLAEGRAQNALDTATDNRINADQQAAADMRALMEAEEKRKQEQAAEDARAQAEHDKAVAEEVAAYRASLDRHVKASNFKDYWEEKGTAGRILAGIIVGAGEAVHSGGGPSPARQIYDNFAKRDTEAKQYRVQQALEAAEKQGKSVEEMRQLGVSLRKAALEKEAARDLAFQKHFEKMSKYGTGPVAAKAGEVAQELAEKQVDYARDMTKLLAERRTDTSGGGSTATTVGRQAGAANDAQERTVRLPDGRVVVAQSKAGAEKIRSMALMDAATQKGLEASDELRRKYQRGEISLLEYNAQKKTVAGSLAAAEKELTGAITEGDEARKAGKIGLTVTEWLSGDTSGAEDRTKELRRSSKDTLDAAIAANAEQVIAPGSAEATRARLSAGDTGGNISLDDKPAPKKAAPEDDRAAKREAAKLHADALQVIRQLSKKKDLTPDEQEALEYSRDIVAKKRGGK